MIPKFTWVTVGEERLKWTWCGSRSKPKHVIDIMGALVQDNDVFMRWLDVNFTTDTTISLGGELKQHGDGSPPSNFRSKDLVMNHNVVHNLQRLIMRTKYASSHTMHGPKSVSVDHKTVSVDQSRIFVNTLPRAQRLLSFNITGSGHIQTTVDDSFTFFSGEYVSNSLMDFLTTFGIHDTQLVKIRESCKGAKYNTYLIDMISFIYLTKNTTEDMNDIFEEEYRLPVIYNESDKEEIYMNTVTDTDNGFKFMVPKDSSIERIYIDFVEALSKYDNPIKESIRDYVNSHYIQRWTDFDVNDTDDAFTIMMIIHAYRCKTSKRTKLEDRVMKSLESQMVYWFDQF